MRTMMHTAERTVIKKMKSSNELWLIYDTSFEFTFSLCYEEYINAGNCNIANNRRIICFDHFGFKSVLWKCIFT